MGSTKYARLILTKQVSLLCTILETASNIHNTNRMLQELKELPSKKKKKKKIIQITGHHTSIQQGQAWDANTAEKSAPQAKPTEDPR